MLEQSYRFHGHGRLRFLYQRGKTYRTKSLSLRLVRNPQRVNGRLAVIVTKTVQKAAPRRNRIRRRVYEVIRTHWEHIAPSHDMIISVYDTQTDIMPPAELEALVVDALKQARVWQEPQKDGKAG